VRLAGLSFFACIYVLHSQIGAFLLVATLKISTIGLEKHLHLGAKLLSAR
jgi:hypothetical protein